MSLCKSFLKRDNVTFIKEWSLWQLLGNYKIMAHLISLHESFARLPHDGLKLETMSMSPCDI